MNTKYFFIIASCIYFTGFPEYPIVKFFSPACIALLCFFPVTILTVGQSRFNMVPILALVYAAVICLILYWQQAVLVCYHSFGDGITSLVAPVFFFFVTWILFSNESKNNIIKALDLALKCLIIILLIDFVWRAIGPLSHGVSVLRFYAYKVNTPFYPDSNAHALNCLVMLELTYYLEKQTSRSYLKSRVATLILSFLTLSRALIIGIALYYVCRYVFAGIKKGNVVLITGTVIVAVIALIYALPVIQEDGSFKTKVEIIEAIQDIRSSDSYSNFVGFGIGNYKYYSASVLGKMRACHNLLGVVVEMGALWSLCTLLWWIWIYKITNGFLRILAIPILAVVTISVYPSTFLGPVYMILALIGIIELQNKSERIAKQQYPILN